MHFDTATRKQLLQIALHEDCPNDYKFEACRELQIRQWHDSMLPDLVKLWGIGKSEFDIAIELGLPQSTVKSQLIKYKLFRKRVGA